MCFGGGGNSNRILAEQRAQEAERQAGITEAVGRANSYFDTPARKGLYDNVYQSTYNTNLEDLNRQREDTARQLAFSTARRSGEGTPQAAYETDRMKQVYDRALARVNSMAEAARSGFMGADNNTRSSLVQQAMSGLNASQIPNLAGTALDVNNNTWLDRANQASIGDVFGDFAKQYSGGQTLAGWRAAANDPAAREWLGTYNTGTANGGGYGGTIGR